MALRFDYNTKHTDHQTRQQRNRRPLPQVRQRHLPTPVVRRLESTSTGQAPQENAGQPVEKHSTRFNQRREAGLTRGRAPPRRTRQLGKARHQMWMPANRRSQNNDRRIWETRHPARTGTQPSHLRLQPTSQSYQDILQQSCQHVRATRQPRPGPTATSTPLPVPSAAQEGRTARPSHLPA